MVYLIEKLFAVCKDSQCPTVEWQESEPHTEMLLRRFFFFFLERGVGPTSTLKESLPAS